MRVRDAWVISEGCVVQLAGVGVSLHEGRVGHARVVEHEAPLQPHEVEGGGDVGGVDVGLQLEAGDEGGDGPFRFGCRSSIGCPAFDEVGTDGAVLFGALGDVGDHGPAIAVLWHQGRGLVVAVHAGCAVPEEAVGGGFDAGGGGLPGRDGGAVIHGGGQDQALVDGVVQNGVCLQYSTSGPSRK